MTLKETIAKMFTDYPSVADMEAEEVSIMFTANGLVSALKHKISEDRFRDMCEKVVMYGSE